MGKGIKFVGLDVHGETITVATAEAYGGEVKVVGTIRNRPEDITKAMRRLSSEDTLFCCYEAGGCGYTLQRQLSGMGIACVVVAPSLIPAKPGDRVKTDRRDAIKLARLLRSGDLTSVWVPDEEHEALRELTRARQLAVDDQTRARNRVNKLLQRLGVRRPKPMAPWEKKHRLWLSTIQLAQPLQQLVLEEYLRAVDQAAERVERLTEAIERAATHSRHAPLIAALQGLRGVGLVTAMTLVAELGDLRRFAKARQVMGYVALTPREASSGARQRRGAVAKTGNSHVRFTVVESGWHYARVAKTSPSIARRREGLSQEVVAIAEKAEQRLHRRFLRLIGRGKSRQQATVAIARELVGFVWAIGQAVPPGQQLQAA